MSTPKTPTPIRTLSHSQLETWSQCPRRWYLTKVARVPQAPSESLALGTALHSTLEADLNLELDGSREGHPLAILSEAFEAILWAELEERDPLHLISMETRNTLHARGMAMLRAYTAEVQDRLRPIAVEEELTAVVPETASALAFTGRLDAITENDAGGRTIVDFKTAGRPWGLGIEHTKDQATAYLWLDAQRLGEQVRAQLRRHKVTFIIFATEPADNAGGYTCVTQVRPTERSAFDTQTYLVQLRDTAMRMAAVRGEEDAAARTGPLCCWCQCLGACPPGQAWLAFYGRTPAVPVITPEMAADLPEHAAVVAEGEVS